jgi:hypothetical protein
MDLRRSFTPEHFARALGAWEWIGIRGKVPLFASPFGDVFFRSDDGFWWLDTVEGMLTLEWKDAQALEADLATPGGQDRYLLAGLALSAESRGLVPGADQVYGFKTPPVLGGTFNVDNVQTIDFAIGLRMAGQFHGQAREAPEAPQELRAP